MVSDLDEVWYAKTSRDPVVSTRAFTAAGILSALRWTDSSELFTDALRRAIRDTSPSMLEWAYPLPGTVATQKPISDAELASAWVSLFASNVSPSRAGVRLGATPSVTAQRSTEFERVTFASQVLNVLTSDWKAGALPGRVDSVSFRLLQSTAKHSWQWPLRISNVDTSAESLLARLARFRRVAKATNIFDVSIATNATRDSVRRLAASKPGLSIIATSIDEALRGSRADFFSQLSSSTTSPIAFVDFNTALLGPFEMELTDELARNKHLDRALFDACLRLGFPPPLLLTPAIGEATLLENARIENRVREIRDQMANMPNDQRIGSITQGLLMGIPSNATTVEEYLEGLNAAIDNGRIAFPTSASGSTALRELAGKLKAGIDSQVFRSARPAPSQERTLDFEVDSADSRSGAAGAMAEVTSPSSTGGGPFQAYPHIYTVEPQASSDGVDFDVGFSDSPDPMASRENRIAIIDARPREDMLVLVAVKNGQMTGKNYARLELNLQSRAAFNAKPMAAALSMEISAELFFRNEHVGTVVKEIALEQSNQTTSPVVITEDFFTPIVSAVTTSSLDLILIVKEEQPEWLTLQAVDCRNGRHSDLLRRRVGDARQHPSKLDRDQRGAGYTGYEAHQLVRGIGQTIADIIPPVLLDEFISPLFESGLPPSVLILTNEPYIPWELALLEVEGMEEPQYLGSIARVGRWWVGARISPPPTHIDVERITAVGADQYAIQTNRKDLPAAREEREWLCATYNAERIIANERKPVVDWLQTLEIPTSGHLAHLALHGISDPNADEHALILGDGSKLLPVLLAGIRSKKYPPRFQMVFLNACQVGVPGTTLGQIAGFPGALLTAGAGSVIGPIWEVSDTSAHDLALKFYKQALSLDANVQISELLRALRKNCDRQGSTTPLAYVFYGHPNLVLNNQLKRTAA